MPILAKPKPKKDITVIHDEFDWKHDIRNRLRIQVANDAARDWARENCKDFGTWYDYGYILLYVKDCYDLNEVMAYIDSYNDRSPYFLFSQDEHTITLNGYCAGKTTAYKKAIRDVINEAVQAACDHASKNVYRQVFIGTAIDRNTIRLGSD